MSDKPVREQLNPVRQGTPALSLVEIGGHLEMLPEWIVLTIDGVAQLQRSFLFRDFAGALAFANAIGVLADTADHHPSLVVEWGKVTVRWWTHTVQGLHANDFVMALRTDDCFRRGAG